MFNKKKKYCLFGQLACFIKILLLTSNSDRFYHCYLNFSSYKPRCQFFHDTAFMKIILNKPLTNCLWLLEKALPTVHVFRQVPTGKHNCIPSSYFLSMIGEVYSASLKKRSRVFLYLNYTGIFQHIWNFYFFFFFLLSLFVWGGGVEGGGVLFFQEKLHISDEMAVTIK